MDTLPDSDVAKALETLNFYGVTTENYKTYLSKFVNQYTIIRPPLHTRFELPTREDLLKVRPGDIVKLVFQVGDETPERMWVQVLSTDDMHAWTGKTDNEPFGKTLATTLPCGKEITFHPLDIINIYE